MLDHLGVQVADVEVSLGFYLRTFAPIGMQEVMRFPVGESFVVGLSGPDGIPNFWLSLAAAAETRELHLALRALTGQPSTRSTPSLWARVRRSCTPLGSGPSTTPATTPSSCVTSTGTTWRPFITDPE